MFFPADQTPAEPLMLSNGPIKWVKEFKYLGGLMSSPYNDMRKRLSQAWDAAKALRKMWKSPLSDRCKVYLFRSLIGSIVLYGNETWVLTKTQRKRFFSGYNSLATALLSRHPLQHTHEDHRCV
jgi:hypothetical protein